MLTKRTTKVESPKRCGCLLFFCGKPKYFCPSNQKWN